ncbi:protein croquemort-like [Schistocerca piceifrons]|uniref:protein croquemort-like n=1 Tax=Schistocerca piceifrons TaxID=274613 RepID=UPI001F5EEED2|nr:protein croquemort-like [Schistocerca piceifrons]
MRCTVRTKKTLVFGIGGGMLVVGVFLGGFMSMIVDSILKSQLVLSEGSTSYNNWIELPIPMYMEFYIFNVSNAAEYEQDPTIKPNLVEMGPYVYREYHKRNITAWNENETVTFQNIRTWYFDEKNSVGPEDDLVTTINVVPAVLNYMSRHMSTGKKLVVSSLLDITNETMFVTKSVRELMFDGYFDLLLNFTNELSLPIPFEEFGYFVDRNGSETYDGVFNMYTGESNLDLLGTVANWNYMNETPYFDSPCNSISGTTGELWAPIKSTADVGIFAPDVCSTLRMRYSGEAEIHGLRGYGYLLSDDVFNASSTEGACFCLAGKDCAPAGLMNASACRFNAPVFVSRPHFLLSDPSLGAAVQGLQPDPDKHNFTLGIEPFTGIPLYVNARLMLNVMLEPVELVSFYEKLPRRIYFPAFWFNQKAVLTEDLAMLAKFIKNAPALGMGLFFGMAGIGLIMVFVGGMLTLRHGWKDS